MGKVTVITKPYTPIVEYTPLAMHKIRHLVRKCSKEVGWFGSVSASEGEGYKYFLIEDIYVPIQSVTGTETDVKAEDLIKLYEEIEASGVDLSTVFYWGHSHVDMAPTPSGQDESQLLEYGEAYPVFLRGIYNKAGVERMDVFDFGNNLRFDEVDADIMVPAMTEDQEKSLDALIKERVSERSYAYVGVNNRGVNNTRGKPQTRVSDLFEEDFDAYGMSYLGGGGGSSSFAPHHVNRTYNNPKIPSITGIQSRR